MVRPVHAERGGDGQRAGQWRFGDGRKRTVGDDARAKLRRRGDRTEHRQHHLAGRRRLPARLDESSEHDVVGRQPGQPGQFRGARGAVHVCVQRGGAGARQLQHGLGDGAGKRRVVRRNVKFGRHGERTGAGADHERVAHAIAHDGRPVVQPDLVEQQRDVGEPRLYRRRHRLHNQRRAGAQRQRQRDG